MSEVLVERARETWDTIDIKKVRDVAWCSIPYFPQKVMARLTGAEQPTAYIHRLLRERLPDRHRHLRGAALVCGDMAAERGFFEPDDIVKFEHVDGYDLSPASLARYTPRGLSFRPTVMDCNCLTLERNQYDLLVGCHGIHHLYNLGNLFYQCHRALNDGGLLYLYEWIGPPYLQIPRRNHLLASLLLWTLFPSRRTRTNHLGQVKGSWLQPGPEVFDPSEACNATELLPQMLKYFQPLRLVAHAGLTYPIFEGLAQNLDPDGWLNRVKFALVDRLETALTRVGLVKPLFLVAVAEKRALCGAG
jgi:SAM-dependent methyltransferase